MPVSPSEDKSRRSGAGRPEARLIEAAIENDAAALAKLMASGVDINAQDEYGMTALHHAASTGARACIRLLVADDRCDCMLQDMFGRYASDIAIEWNRDYAVGRLLTKIQLRQSARADASVKPEKKRGKLLTTVELQTLRRSGLVEFYERGKMHYDAEVRFLTTELLDQLPGVAPPSADELAGFLATLLGSDQQFHAHMAKILDTAPSHYGPFAAMLARYIVAASEMQELDIGARTDPDSPLHISMTELNARTQRFLGSMKSHPALAHLISYKTLMENYRRYLIARFSVG